jgi:hypothetical protein
MKIVSPVRVSKVINVSEATGFVCSALDINIHFVSKIHRYGLYTVVVSIDVLLHNMPQEVQGYCM